MILGYHIEAIEYEQMIQSMVPREDASTQNLIKGSSRLENKYNGY
jgi:hypothetical protein